MNRKVLEFIKNILYAVSANVSRILTTLVLTLLLPKLMSVEDYSYWQLYGFYGVYLAYSSLGWCEGTYLKYAGKNYKELDGRIMSSQFAGLALYEAVFCGLLFLAVTPFSGNENKTIALGMSLTYTWIQILRFQLQTILQATNRISDYAKVYSGERVLNFILVMYCMIMGKYRFWFVAGMEIISNFCMAGYAVMLCRDVIFKKPVPFSSAFNETKELIGMGYKLALAGLASQMIIGTVRWGIEQKWGTIVFGKISLSFSMANMMITCIAAVSIVLFPILRRCEKERLEGLYHPIRVCMTIPMYGLLLIYIPAKLVLSLWLPQYKESLHYLAILFPLCIYETRNTVLTWTYLKTIWRESDIMRANLVTVAISIAMTGISVFWMKNLDFAVASIIILYAIKSIYTEYLLGKYMAVFRKKDILLETGLTSAFVLCSWYLSDIWSFIGYLVIYLLYLLLEKRDISFSVEKMRELLKTE